MSGYSMGQNPAGAPSIRGQSLIENSKAVFQAQVSKDVDALKRLLSDNFRQVGSDGRLTDTDGKSNDKDEAIDDARDGSLREFRLYGFEVLPVDDNAIIVSYDAIIRKSEGDAPAQAPRYQHLSDLWVKQGDQWRLRFRQATAVRHID